MQALTLPARRGLRWLSEGFLIFRKRPALLTFLVLGYWMTMAVVSAIPYIGQLIGFVVIPVFSVSLMNACRLIDQGGEGQLLPQLLFSGFHRNLQTLLVLGVVYVAVSMAVLGFSALFDGGVLFRMLVQGVKPGEEALLGGQVMLAAQLTIVLLVPVMMAFWYAPVLVAWHDMSAGKSLFFSLIACARNWRPFMLYSLAVVAIGAMAPRLIGVLLHSFLGEASGLLSTVFTVTLVLIFLPTLYASFYVSYRDVFVTVDDDA